MKEEKNYGKPVYEADQVNAKIRYEGDFQMEYQNPTDHGQPMPFPKGQSVTQNTPMAPIGTGDKYLDDAKYRNTVLDVELKDGPIGVPGRVFLGDKPKAIHPDDTRMWIYHTYIEGIGKGDEKEVVVKEALGKNLNYKHITFEDYDKVSSANRLLRVTKTMVNGKPMAPMHLGLPFCSQLPVQNQAQGFSATIEILGKAYHMLDGTQMIVDKNVTDDLAMTDMEAVGIEDVPFYRSSLEFFFENPDLPTVLVYRGRMIDMAERLGVEHLWRVDKSFFDESINFYCETPTGQGMAFRAREDNWNEMLSCDNETIERLEGSVKFHEDEWAKLRDLFRLCIKVLAYSSIPRLNPVPSTKRDQKRAGSAIAGINGRPKRDSVRVVYLPELAKEVKSSEDLTGKKHAFKGRRGTLRFYKHERYVNMRGKYQYIPPIAGPNGEIPKAIFKVRKP